LVAEELHAAEYAQEAVQAPGASGSSGEQHYFSDLYPRASGIPHLSDHPCLGVTNIGSE
jgi:hypothetical protein